MLPRLLSRNAPAFATFQVPTIDMTTYLSKTPGWEDDCLQTARLMKDYGLVYAKDPRVDHSKNSVFLDQMEAYFDLRAKQFDRGIKDLDVSGD
jgi:hypothetical protein